MTIDTHTDTWQAFETELRAFLTALADPTLHDTVRICAPDPGEGVRRITLHGLTRDGSDCVSVTVRGSRMSRRTYRLADDEMGDAAAYIRTELTDRWGVAHPTLLTAQADGPAAQRLRLLGMGVAR